MILTALFFVIFVPLCEDVLWITAGGCTGLFVAFAVKRRGFLREDGACRGGGGGVYMRVSPGGRGGIML